MVDAEEWLQKYRASRFIADRGRGIALQEPMSAGDVFDDGSVLTQSGIVVWRNALVWMDWKKVGAAKYYGWRERGERAVCPQSGVMLYLMAR